MFFDAAQDLFIRWLHIIGNAKGTIVHMPPGAPGNLSDLRRGQGTPAGTIEFAQLGEGNMVNVHIQPHANRIGGDQIIDLSGLIHLHLGIAGAGAQCAQDNRRAAALLADRLCQFIDLIDRKGDNRTAPFQAVEFLCPGIAEGRQAGAAFDHRIGDQMPDQARHAVRPQEHGFKPSPGMQQTVCENMTPLWICTELNFIDGHEINGPIHRHGFDGTDEIARIGGQDFLLPRDQGNGGHPNTGDNAVIVFPGQQAQGKADHARHLPQHAFHR